MGLPRTHATASSSSAFGARHLHELVAEWMEREGGVAQARTRVLPGTRSSNYEGMAEALLSAYREAGPCRHRPPREVLAQVTR